MGIATIICCRAATRPLAAAMRSASDEKYIAFVDFERGRFVYTDPYFDFFDEHRAFSNNTCTVDVSPP